MGQPFNSIVRIFNTILDHELASRKYKILCMNIIQWKLLENVDTEILIHHHTKHYVMEYFYQYYDSLKQDLNLSYQETPIK